MYFLVTGGVEPVGRHIACAMADEEYFCRANFIVVDISVICYISFVTVVHGGLATGEVIVDTISNVK